MLLVHDVLSLSVSGFHDVVCDTTDVSIDLSKRSSIAVFGIMNSNDHGLCSAHKNNSLG